MVIQFPGLSTFRKHDLKTMFPCLSHGVVSLHDSINSFQFSLCNTEDEVEAAETLSAGAPTAAPQSTESPSVRDATPQQNLKHRQPHNAQKYREETSVKKTIESKIDETKKKLNEITRLENILARRLKDDSTNYYSKNSTSTVEGPRDEPSQHLSASSKLHAKQNALDIKFLERVLQTRLDPNGTLYSQNTTSPAENLQEETNDKSDSENEHNKDNSIAVFNLGSGDGTGSDNTITLKTVHENVGETTEIVDSPSTGSEALNPEVLDQPVTFTNKIPADMAEKPLVAKTSPDVAMKTDSSSKLGLGTGEKGQAKISRRKKEKQLADVDRFILDELYRKKMMEDAGRKPLGSSGGARPQGKTALVTSEASGQVSGYNTKNQGSSNNMENTDDNNDSYTHSSRDNNDHSNLNNNKNNNNGVIQNNFSESNNSNSYSNNNASNSHMSVHESDNHFVNNAVVIEQSNNHSPSTDSVDNHVQWTTTASTSSNNSNINNNNDAISGKVNHVQSTTAVSNNSNNMKNNNNDVISGKINDNNNNTNPNHNNKNYPLNTKVDPEQSVTPPIIEHVTSEITPSSRNITPHYNLLPAKLGFIKNLNKAGSSGDKVTARNKPHLFKILSDKKRVKDKNDVSLDTLWDNYLADNQLLNGGAVVFDEADKITNGKTPFERNSSDAYDSSTDVRRPGEVKLVNGVKIIPGDKVVSTLLETGKSGRQGKYLPVLHSSDPDLPISP